LDRLTLSQSTQLYRLLGDASRLRLLTVLQHYSLSVAELTQITGLAQSRVSTHLSRLKRAGLLLSERRGSAALYSASTTPRAADLLATLRDRLADPTLQLDRARAEEVIQARREGRSWAESVAGSMELHYSPGRTWQATAGALNALLDLGDTIDIASGDGALAELLADRARAVTCVDISGKVLQAARKRLHSKLNVQFCQADMHRLPLPDACADHVFAMHALPYARAPAQVIAEAARLLRPGGRAIFVTLAAHRHDATRLVYDHVNLGHTPEQIAEWFATCGLKPTLCAITSRELRPPFFQIVTAVGVR
jgi:SAM-dependent methyltransferase